MELQAAREAAKAKKKGGIFGAIGSIAGSLLGTEAGSSAVMGGIGKVASLFMSDARLKTNIKHYDTLDNGIKLYTWDWTDTAIQKGAGDLPSYGVIAQDIQNNFPEAVYAGADGYLRVDYNKVTQ